MNQRALIKLVSNNNDLQEFIREGGYGKNKVRTFDGLDFEQVESHGGGEGSGEERWIVFSVVSEGQKTFWKLPGWYQSYHGSEFNWDEIFEVKSAEKVITVWASV